MCIRDRYKIAVRSIPEITDIAKGKRLITEFVDLDMDDLLERVVVEPFESLMKKNIFQKTILITGSGGSIGSELCRQIIKFKPEKLLLVEISEYALYTIHSELELCLLYTSPSPRDRTRSRMPSSA